MSVEELKIRGELEMEVERDLEEEIKDSIYHLALRLHQLKKARHFNYQNSTREYMSEVNINITMEGGANKMKKKGSRTNRPTLVITSAARSPPNVGGHSAGSPCHHKSKFNWEKSLRKESNPSLFIKKSPPKNPVGYAHWSAKNEVPKWKY
ncbi:hypothetical protein F511_00036 [Dorcoceras hygrometricum]|nr:hypothetical protein F511_00036 [Dorcoceras hygrometricum]